MKQNTAKVTEESRLKTPVADVVRLRLGWLSSWWGQEIMDGMLHRGFVKQKTIWLYNRSWRLKPWELPFEAFMWEVYKIRPVIDFLYDFGVVFVRMKLQQGGPFWWVAVSVTECCFLNIPGVWFTCEKLYERSMATKISQHQFCMEDVWAAAVSTADSEAEKVRNFQRRLRSLSRGRNRWVNDLQIFKIDNKHFRWK